MVKFFRLCQLCIGKVPGGWCNSQDPYIGFEGAFRCLVEAGEVAFLKHTTVQEMVDSKLYKGKSADEFELICKNGQRMAVGEYLQCNWGMVPSNALVVSSAKPIDERKHIQRFLQSAVRHYAHKASSNSSNNFENRDRFNINTNNNRFDDRFNRNDDRNGRNPFGTSSTTANPFNNTILYENFEMFESERYGRRLNLLFQDSTYGLKLIDERDQTFKSYLGNHEEIIYDIRQCPIKKMTMCVTSDPEFEKCVKMKVSFYSFI